MQFLKENGGSTGYEGENPSSKILQIELASGGING